MNWSRFFLIFSLFSLLSSVFAQADDLSENQARFGTIMGDVGLLTQGAREWIEPHEGMPIEPGDHIRTGEDGEVELILSQNVFWWVQPETDLIAEHMETGAGRLSLASGVLLGKVDSSHAAGGQHWEFNTPAAVCNVRGTEFALDVSPPLPIGGSANASVAEKGEGTHLGVFEGEVEMRPAEGPSGEAPAIRIGSRQEGFAQRGKLLKTLNALSPRMQSFQAKVPQLRARLARIQRTWSPYTPAVRHELRSKFVKPLPKPGPHVPRPPRQPRPPRPQ